MRPHALAAVLLTSPAAWAQDRGDHPWRGQLSLGGNYYAGNLDQLQAALSGYSSHSSEKVGYDLILSGFRMWLGGEDGYTRIGDDLAVTGVPFWYLKPKLYVHGSARYERSQLHQLDHRLNGGGGAGYAPVRREDSLLRVALGAQIEQARYPGDDFRLDGAHDGSTRTVPRATLFSNGWYRVEGTPVSLRYLGSFLLNPLDPQDLRLSLDASAGLQVSRLFSAQVTGTYAYNSVVLTGVEPQDLRLTAGLALSTPPPE